MTFKMQRPSGQGMPILFDRPAYEWVARVNQKHKQLDDLQCPAEEQRKLDRWIAIEFVYSTLKLEGLDIPRDLVARICSSEAGLADSTNVEPARSLFESLQTVSKIARQQNNDAVLTADLLHELNEAPIAQGLSDGDAAVRHQQLILDSACEWFSADSFRELHPVEQASIVFLRLIDIRAFAERNERTALLAASLFTLRTGLPPIIIEPDLQAAYRTSLNEGLRMNTKPMVELIGQSVEKSLEALILLAKK